jgi:hypothetical protein
LTYSGPNDAIRGAAADTIMIPHRHPNPATGRHHQPRWTAFLIATLLAATAMAVPSLLALPDGRAALIEQLLAVVNGKTIALSDLRRYRLLVAPDAPPEQALQRMIDHQLLLVEAVRFDIEPPEPTRIREAVQRLEQAAGGRAAWEAALQREHLTPSEAEQVIAEYLRTDELLAQRVDQFVIVSRTEVEAAYEQETERFQGRSLEEVAAQIERELLEQKVTVKRQEYLSRLRARATITVLTDAPGTLPASP